MNAALEARWSEPGGQVKPGGVNGCFTGGAPRLPRWHPPRLPPSLHPPVALGVRYLSSSLLPFFSMYKLEFLKHSQALRLSCVQKRIDLVRGLLVEEDFGQFGIYKQCNADNMTIWHFFLSSSFHFTLYFSCSGLFTQPCPMPIR